MIGILFFVLLGVFFFALSIFTRWFFRFLNRKIGFASFPIWLKIIIYALYPFAIFMLLFGDEWLGRIQHPKMCEKYAYLKYDRDKLFNSELDKDSLRSRSEEFEIKYTLYSMMVDKIFYTNPNTNEVYFEKTTVVRREGWIARFTGINFASLINQNEVFFGYGFSDRCAEIFFEGKSNWNTPPDISVRLKYLDIDDGVFLSYY